MLHPGTAPRQPPKGRAVQFKISPVKEVTVPPPPPPPPPSPPVSSSSPATTNNPNEKDADAHESLLEKVFVTAVLAKNAEAKMENSSLLANSSQQRQPSKPQSQPSPPPTPTPTPPSQLADNCHSVQC